MFNFKVLNKKIKKNKNSNYVICKNQGSENEVYDRVYEHSKIVDGLEQLKKHQIFYYKHTLDELKINIILKKIFLKKNLKIIKPKKIFLNIQLEVDLLCFCIIQLEYLKT